MIRDLSYFFSMSSNDGLAVVCRQIKDIECTSGGATGNFRGILAKCNISDNTIIRSFERKLGKIHGPNPKHLILTSRDTKAPTQHNTTNGRIIMQLINLLQLMRIIIDLKQQSILTANKHMTNLCCLLYWIWIVETVLEIEDGEDCVAGVMV